MKKALMFCFGIFLSAISTWAQPPAVNWSGFYIGANAGYNWPHAGGFNGANGPISGTGTLNSTNAVQTIDFSKSSYGAGVGVNLNLGYMLNPHLGIDLQVGTAFGKKNVFEYTQTGGSGTIRETITTQSKTPWYVAPSVLVSTGATRPLSVYTRMGVVLPFGGNVIERYLYENDISSIDDLTDEEYDFAMSKGLIGSLGMNYRISPALSVIAELRGMSLTRYVKSSEITAATSNGVNVLDQYDVDQREFEYSSSYTYDPVTQTASMPSLRHAVGLPYSNFGVNVGAVYNFNPAPAHNPNDTTMPLGGRPGLFGRFGVGYNGPHAGNYYVGDGYGSLPIAGTERYTFGSGVNTIDFSKASYGSGANVTVAGGYMFNPYFGAELGITINIPRQQTFEYREVDTIGVGFFTDEISSRPKMPIFITPAFIVSTGVHRPLSVYGRAGLVLPVGGDLVVSTTSTDHTLNEVTETEERFKYGMSKGLQGALGLQYNVTDALGITFEANGTSLTRYTKSSEYTMYTVNGVDLLGDLTTEQRETEYIHSGTFDPTATNANTPWKARTIASPFSTYGFQLGARIRF